MASYDDVRIEEALVAELHSEGSDQEVADVSQPQPVKRVFARVSVAVLLTVAATVAFAAGMWQQVPSKTQTALAKVIQTDMGWNDAGDCGCEWIHHCNCADLHREDGGACHQACMDANSRARFCDNCPAAFNDPTYWGYR